MRATGLTAGLLAAVGIFAWTGASRAGDTIRLNMVDQVPTQNLVDDGQGADTIRTWHRGFGGAGFGWGGRGLGWGWGGRGLGWGWGAPGLGWGWGGGGLGLGGWGVPAIGWGGLYPSYGFGLGYGGLFGPCAGATAGTYTLYMPSANLGTPVLGGPAVAPQQAPAEQTFPYDGGPVNPVPQTKDAPAPTSNPPQRSVPLEGRSVSLPKATPKWSFPAYGETARRTIRDSDRTYLTRGDAKKSDAR
jgi:hypothetical protein